MEVVQGETGRSRVVLRGGPTGKRDRIFSASAQVSADRGLAIGWWGLDFALVVHKTQLNTFYRLSKGRSEKMAPVSLRCEQTFHQASA